MPISADSSRLSSVDPTNTSEASRTTWLGMGLAERADNMIMTTTIMTTSTLMGGVLCRQRHHRRCFVLRDTTVRRELVSRNSFECAAEINT